MIEGLETSARLRYIKLMNTTTTAQAVRAALTAAGIDRVGVGATNGRVLITASSPTIAKAAWATLRTFARANGLKMATHRGYSIWHTEYGTAYVCGATWALSTEETDRVLKGLGESVAA